MFFSKDITKEGNPVLKQKCSNVTLPLSSADYEVLKGLYEYVIISANDELVKQYNIRPGVGIAAAQVGVCKKMFAINVVDFLDEKQTTYLYAVINPQIIKRSEVMTYLPGGEGCLSVDRETTGITPRHYSITFKAALYDFRTNKAKFVTQTLEGYPAIVFQHEYDHLFGTLYVDTIIDEEQAKKSGMKPLWEE